MSYKQGDRSIANIPFSDIHVGQKAQLAHTITEDDLNKFASLVGDFNPSHIDPEYSRATALGKPTVHGMLTSSFISALIGMVLPGKGALWVEQTLRFLRPAFVGDKISVNAEVTQTSPATSTIILKIEISNQHGLTVVAGDSTVQISDGTAPKTADSTAKKQAGPEVRIFDDQTDHVVLVTGGSGGIGAACARDLASAGFSVAVNYNSNEAAADTIVSEISSAGGKAFAVQADVANAVQVEVMFDEIERHLGSVEGLVHCAAQEPVPTLFDETGWTAFDDAFQIQVGGAHHCLERALPNMLEHKIGSIVLIGSIYAEGKPPVRQSAYVTAKAALAGFARALATELGPNGVRVNVVAPGITQTKMTANLPQKTMMLAKMNTPLRRLAEPDDVAPVVTFLIGDAARHITGESLTVSGGA